MTNHHCRVCESKTTVKFEVQGWPLGECKSCGLLQVVKKPSADELQSIYSEAYYESSKYKNPAPLEKEMSRRLKLLKECGLPKGSRVLEIGSADGFFAEKLIDEGLDVFVNDFSPSIIERLSQRLPIDKTHFQSGPVESLDYPDQFFDAIIFWDVIEHVWSAQDLASCVARWLKKDGYLLLSSPDISSLSFKMMGKKWPFMTPPEHLTFFSEKPLAKLFERKSIELQKFFRRGKWVDIKFLIYKMGRVMPKFGALKVQDRLPSAFDQKMVYVPTNDIFYAKLQKREP